MKKHANLMAVIVLAGTIAAGTALAQGGSKAAVPAVITGDNVCLGCTLKKESGAAAQCSVYGHQHVLRVAQASLDGKEAQDLKGQFLHYLPTDSSKDLIGAHHGEKLTVVGKVYVDARVLEVASVKSSGTPGEGSSTKKPDHPEHPKKSEHPDHPK